MVTERAGHRKGGCNLVLIWTRGTMILTECMPQQFKNSCGGGGGALIAKLCPTLVTPWTVVHQAPLSMGFSRQEYWSGLPFPSPGNLPDPGIKPEYPAL